MKGVTKVDEGVILDLWVQPNSKKTEIAGYYGDYIKIRLNAPPVNGKANKECLRYLADILFIKKTSLRIIRGESDRHKRVIAIDADVDNVVARIGAIIEAE